jgi:hypothetical protein
MEFIKVLINLFLGEEKSKGLEPLLEIFSNNNFDIKSSLSHLNVETVLPLLTSLFSDVTSPKKPATTETFTDYREYCGDELADRFDAYFNG